MSADQTTAKRQLTIRQIPASEFTALEQMARRLGLPNEKFGRIALRIVARDGPRIFEQALRDAQGPAVFEDEPVEDDEE